MSIVKLTDDKFEHFTLVTNPLREFTSSSLGITGSINLYARTNRILKEAVPYFSSSFFDETVGVSTELLTAKRFALHASNISDKVSLYMNAVSSESLSLRNEKSLTVQRLTPSYEITKNYQKKSIVKDILIPYYKSVYPSAQYAYTNYHSLNFFTASSVPTGSVMIYPVSYSGNTPASYVPTSAFTLDFYLNPRYTNSSSIEFTAGTIMHISSTFALSLVTGSNVDENGMKKSYRLMLQLSSSADIPPSSISLSGTNNNRPVPHNFVFLSNDNFLKYNTWHHVAINWGTSIKNHGTGTFFIDGENAGVFTVPSSSIHTSNRNAAAIFLGNFFEGAPSVDLTNFFNATAATTEGIRSYSTGTINPSGEIHFRHPLNAELHDIKIFNTSRTNEQILTSSVQGVKDLSELIFYVPGFFVKETFSRNVLKTPFYSSTISTTTPINANLSFSVDGHVLNIEHFLREFIKGEYPRLLNLTASVYTGSVVSGLTANDYLYKNPSVVKRNLTILPCDNGKFTPNYDLLRSGTIAAYVLSSSETCKFVTDQGGLNLQLITLNNMLDENLLQSSVSGGLESDVFGPTPDNPSIEPGAVPSTFQKTRDGSSNDIVIFDIPNIFYGRRIFPNTVELTDNNLTGSNHLIKMTIKDDGAGNLYRADSLSKHATWNSVGTVFYNEGIILIKSPNIPFFGKEQFDLSFKGERNIYVSKINVTAQSGQVNSSSNPAYKDVKPSLNAHENDENFVYITGITLHDENLNVVARTNLSQPVIKRSTDKIQFRIKMDY